MKNPYNEINEVLGKEDEELCNKKNLKIILRYSKIISKN